jgi:hypothetical protein
MLGILFSKGTGACIDTKFYCKNEGHIGASIPSSRVNDGLCGEYLFDWPAGTSLGVWPTIVDVTIFF